MKQSITRGRPVRMLAAFGFAALIVAPQANATLPYSYPPPFPQVTIGKGMITPDRAFGKEYSHDPDVTSALPGGGLAPAQVIAWDGQLPGGAADGRNFSVPPPPFAPNGDFQIDALANSHDAFFKSLVVSDPAGGVTFPDRAHLVFSIDDRAHTVLSSGLLPVAIPAGGPIPTTGGNLIGGSGEISYEHAGAFHPPSSQGIWAPLPQVNGMPLPRDIDGLEIWGPEPFSVPAGGDASAFSDSDKYSVDTDISTTPPLGGPAVSVWNYSPAGGSSPYVTHDKVVSLVRLLLDEPNFPHDLVNLDALMVQDDFGEDIRFDPGDKILFSIRQVPATFALDGSGFLATGAEIFWMDGASTPAAPVGGFLYHGGHFWDKAYALSDMQTVIDGPDGPVRVQLDINALEAIGRVVPEPASALLLLVGMTAVAGLRRRG